MDKIEIISDLTAPCPSGFVRTELGWMPLRRKIIDKINEIIEHINNTHPADSN